MAARRPRVRVSPGRAGDIVEVRSVVAHADRVDVRRAAAEAPAPTTSALDRLVDARGGASGSNVTSACRSVTTASTTPGSARSASKTAREARHPPAGAREAPRPRRVRAPRSRSAFPERVRAPRARRAPPGPRSRWRPRPACRRGRRSVSTLPPSGQRAVARAAAAAGSSKGARLAPRHERAVLARRAIGEAFARERRARARRRFASAPCGRTDDRERPEHLRARRRDDRLGGRARRHRPRGRARRAASRRRSGSPRRAGESLRGARTARATMRRSSSGAIGIAHCARTPRDRGTTGARRAATPCAAQSSIARRIEASSPACPPQATFATCAQA